MRFIIRFSYVNVNTKTYEFFSVFCVYLLKKVYFYDNIFKYYNTGVMAMKKFEGILICTDLDGTLLKNDKSISKENSEAIEYFKSEGGLFTFVTGRMHFYSVDTYNKVKPNAPIGCINGGGIYDFEKKDYVWNSVLDHEVIEIVEYVDKEFPDIGIQITTMDKAYFSKDNEAMVWFRRVTGLEKLEAPYMDVKEPLAKVIFAHESNERLTALADALKNHPKADNYQFVRTEKRLYEIVPKGITKGTVINKFAEIYNINKDKIVAIGDYDNDVGMIEAAGIGIAVANACESAKKAADIITVSNEENAIAKVIYDIEYGNIKIQK